MAVIKSRKKDYIEISFRVIFGEEDIEIIKEIDKNEEILWNFITREGFWSIKKSRRSTESTNRVQ